MITEEDFKQFVIELKRSTDVTCTERLEVSGVSAHKINAWLNKGKEISAIEVLKYIYSEEIAKTQSFTDISLRKYCEVISHYKSDDYRRLKSILRK